MSFENEAAKIAHQAGGSFKTVHDREKILRKFANILKHDLNIQVRSAAQLKLNHIEAYIQHRLKANGALRTLQNEMSAIRTLLRMTKREQLLSHERLSNKSLGLSGASREGTKRAMPDTMFHEVFRNALARNREIAAAILIARRLGLRAEEAIQSCQSLGTWMKHLESGARTIRIVFGTKGDRPRDLYIHDVARAEILQAVRFAHAVASNNGGRIVSKPNLKAAMNHFHYECGSLGMVEKYAPHSLRYAFAVTQVRRYIEIGYTEKEAYAATSMDLGHGDGRGYYIKRVYTK